MPTAVEVLTTGTYQRLPSIMHKIAYENSNAPLFPLKPEDVEPTKTELTRWLHVRFLAEDLPAGITSSKIGSFLFPIISLQQPHIPQRMAS